MYDIIIVGAGPAGIGLGILFEKCGVENYCILERESIGSSFKNWPSYTRFISPSFSGNFFNAVDLNAVSPDTSPAYTLQTEHPSGKEYAEYLQRIVEHFGLKIYAGDVQSINKEGDTFTLTTDQEVYTSRFVVWAGGEFGNPADQIFDGAELCVHSSVAEEFPDDEYVIIGGYESGLELAAHLLHKGKTVTVLDSGTPWEDNVSDSSISVAPATRDRLHPFLGTDRLYLQGNSRVTKVEKVEEGYKLTVNDDQHILSTNSPILGTGFHSLAPVVENLFEEDEYGIALTEDDESTKTPGLFLVGPQVRQSGVIFCFIYKFRQRFPIFAEAILLRLGLSDDSIDEYKNANMYLKDLSCCTDECTC